MGTDHLYFRWFLADDGVAMVRHECIGGVTLEWRPPPPWRFTGNGFEPSFHCQHCGKHVILGAADRVEP